ncbi:MAG: hypothetical protein B9S37_07635 [Verrucomicrobiia bacterium Tous-C3TDCM]|nr:MAG: hypothetical protein B9S37_07635 [Verrucomicrobiae bacterium Tous-C3TDCM]PAZ04798.1 MAG: hypothetical protein CAK88_10175 [Verrucomicrobiae bacterium AMD-G2]
MLFLRKRNARVTNGGRKFNLVKIFYYLNTSKSINWGSQATSAGIRHLVDVSYPDAEFAPIDFAPLPLRWFPYLRIIPDLLLIYCIKNNVKKGLERLLQWYGIKPEIYSQCDAVLFNGEGSIHNKSGHFFRLIASLYAFKLNGKIVISMNQTVDVPGNGMHAKILKLVYSKLDSVYSREPVTYRLLKSMGIENSVIGDAAYALPKMHSDRIDKLVLDYNLPDDFIALTGSSFLDKNKKSVERIIAVIDAISTLNFPIIFLANTKTDLYLAKKVEKIRNLRIISYKDAKFEEGMAIVAKAKLLIGGRQHPNIFAAIYGTPFIGMEGNTHKMKGVIELLKYPIPSMNWKINEVELFLLAERIINHEVSFSQVDVPVVDSVKIF